MKRPGSIRWLVPAVISGGLLPFVSMSERALSHRLGANPIATLLNQLGLLALIFLCACLACTPLKLLFGWTWPARIRKTLGLFAFFTALAHFTVYFTLDQDFAWAALFADVMKRPFIVLGLVALLLLLPLALTSTRGAPARLGFARWKRLHRLVYAVGVLAVTHFYLRVKADHSLPLAYAAVLAVLLAVRVYAAIVRARARRARAAGNLPA